MHARRSIRRRCTTEAAAPSFEADIRPLFRESDRRAMKFLLDLWAYEEVRDQAKDILAQLESGDMPCDDTWPKDQVEVLRRWIDGGCPP